MPRRNNYHRSRKETDNLALQFYNSTLRHNPSLRHKCSDRHILDATISSWKDEHYHRTGVRIKGMSRSQFIFSLKNRWKLIDVKVVEEGVIVWSDRANAADAAEDTAGTNRHVVNGDSKEDKIAKTIERIRNSRLEMESNRHGVEIDPITLSPNNDDGVLRVGEQATQTVYIHNTSDADVHCLIKDKIAKQRGIRIHGDKEFLVFANSSESIDVSFTPKRFGIDKSIVVFEFESVGDGDDEFSEWVGPGDDDDRDHSPKRFTITRYITLRSGDPDDYDIIKPIAPYVKKQKKRGEGDKFVNPVKANAGRSGAMVPFRFKLGKFPIPSRLLNENFRKDSAEDFMHAMYGGGERNEGMDYSSLLTDENYSDCMKYLLWFEELQMKKDITTYDLDNAPLRRHEGRYYTLRVPGLAENRPSVLKGDRIIISVSGRGKFEGVVQRTTNEDAILEFNPSFHRVFIDGLRVDVRFTFSRTTLRTSHQALAAVNQQKDLFQKILFPEMLDVETNPPEDPLNMRVIRPSQLTFYNRTLNQEQQSAVVGILHSIARPAPYLIYGPPVSKNCERLL